MEYEVGNRLDKIGAAQQELAINQVVILKVLEEIAPDKYKKAIDTLRKESKEPNE